MIVDSEGKELQACNDGRGVVKFGNRAQPGEPRRIYIGGYHPFDKKAKPLELGGADERGLYRMLKDWSEEAQRRGGRS